MKAVGENGIQDTPIEFHELISPFIRSMRDQLPNLGIRLRTNKVLELFHFIRYNQRRLNGELPEPLANILDKFGVSADACSRMGWTLTHFAVEVGDFSLLKTLIENGAPIDVADLNGNAPLRIAVQRNDYWMCEILLLHGADPNDRNFFNGMSSFHIACKSGSREIVKLLLDYGAEINLPNCNGDTGAHFAQRNGRYDVLSILAERKANFRIKNFRFETARGTSKESQEAIALGTWRASFHLKKFHGFFEEPNSRTKSEVSIRFLKDSIKVKRTIILSMSVGESTRFSWAPQMVIDLLNHEFISIRLPFSAGKLLVKVVHAKEAQELLTDMLRKMFPTWYVCESVGFLTKDSEKCNELVEEHKRLYLLAKTQKASSSVSFKHFMETLNKLNNIHVRLAEMRDYLIKVDVFSRGYSLALESKIETINRVISFNVSLGHIDVVQIFENRRKLFEKEQLEMKEISELLPILKSKILSNVDAWINETPQSIDPSYIPPDLNTKAVEELRLLFQKQIPKKSLSKSAKDFSDRISKTIKSKINFSSTLRRLSLPDFRMNKEAGNSEIKEELGIIGENNDENVHKYKESTLARDSPQLIPGEDSEEYEENSVDFDKFTPVDPDFSPPVAFSNNNSDSICVMCNAAPRNSLLIPCNHIVYCSKCASTQTFAQCPTCDSTITMVFDLV